MTATWGRAGSGPVLRLLVATFWLVAATLFVWSLPASYGDRMRTCPDAGCPGQALTTREVTALHRLGLTQSDYALTGLVLVALVALTYLTVAMVLLVVAGTRRDGLVTAAVLVAVGVVFAQTVPDLVDAHPLAAGLVAGFEVLADAAFFTWVLTFPDGRFRPRWSALLVVVLALTETAARVGHPLPGAVEAVGGLLLLGLVVAVVVVRGRRLDGGERRRGAWVAAALGGAVATLAVVTTAQQGFGVGPGSPLDLMLQVLIVLAFSLVPVALAAAVLRRRLFDVRASVARATTYALLVTAAVSAYLLAIGAAAFTGGRDVAAVVTTAVVAVGMHPAYRWLLARVNHALYGTAQDPAALLARFATAPDPTSAPTVALAEVAATVHRATRLPYVEVAVAHVGSASAGTRPEGWPVEDLPLEHLGVTAGVLRVAARDPDAALTDRDRRALEPVLTHLRLLAYAALRDHQLHDSHRELVTAREEERRRIRNDLHDGVGPTLGAVRLSLAAAANQLDADPATARRLIGEARGLTADVLVDVRRLVYGLRPPALDELGLVGAVAGFVRGTESHRMSVTVRAARDLPELPAAIEVAAYRIALEAVTNALRHSGGSRCEVSFDVHDDRLLLRVVDDGRGGRGEGLGVASMRERATELAGCFDRIAGPEGTSVHVALPIGVGAP